jgi:hypothetical protein
MRLGGGDARAKDAKRKIGGPRYFVASTNFSRGKTMATIPAQTPATLEARVLIGWMDHDTAVNYLTRNCVADPPYTAQSAEQLWEEYHNRCLALPEREAAAPARLPMTPQEDHHANRFMAFIRSLGPNPFVDVIKVELMGLVVHQLYVATSRAEEYAHRVRDDGWLHEAVPLTPRPPALINTRVTVTGLHSAADIDIPHAEFAFLPDPTGQFFSVQQLQSYISVMRGPGIGPERLMLKAGYHRSFARAVSMMPTATLPTAVVALERNTFGGPPNQLLGAGLTVQTTGLRPTGRRPALFSDFFDENLFIKVNLRQKRYQLQVRSTWVEIDA